MLLKKLSKNIAIILVFTHSICSSVYSIESKKNEEVINNQPSIDYLDKIPKGEYLLGPGDSITIIFNSASKLSTRQTVDGDGTIFTSRLKRIYVEGLSINELTKLLERKYSEFLIEPNISILVTTYRPINIYVQGEVQNPGVYLIKGGEINLSLGNVNDPFGDDFLNPSDLTEDQRTLIEKFPDEYDERFQKKKTVYDGPVAPKLFDAIKRAGGITLYSDLRSVEVVRKQSISNGGGRIRARLDFLSVLENGEGAENIRLRDGDIIRINKSELALNEQLKIATRTNLHSKFNKVFISGRVYYPGAKVINKSATLNDLIVLSGGMKPLKGKVTFVRFLSDGTLERRSIRYRKNAKDNTYHNPVLRSGDIVNVEDSLIAKTSVGISEITNPFLGLYSTYKVIESITN
ncbi:polysaccharide export-related periplasmic protein [Prochlorococcus marinus subsp. marinus str. CCMP1375]|uniref:Polysaccharide export-related periplasmic protein n=2 Tax=Prochlorococcaceae TaxID=2881426 RepID=Q7VAY7_PROMA|nr:polysaccharide export-related periplasmic protein [Prochlorococcus marinus subsp. marinus str. CCMP1375]